MGDTDEEADRNHDENLKSVLNAGTGIGRERICGIKAVLRFISGKL